MPELGAKVEAGGTRFSLFAPLAERVELCLFDEAGHETRRDLVREEDAWRLHVSGVGAGQRYGYRVHGPWDPSRGLRFNPRKLLLDPYARATSGVGEVGPELHSGDRVRDERDSARLVPKGVVLDPRFDWREDHEPQRRPWSQTVIYEAHVRGLTMRHPDVEPELRGTYLGLASPPVIEHLLRLGVTALELLPVQASVKEPFLHKRGLSNYWGYATIGFFAPHPAYATSPEAAPAELKEAIRRLHAAGIEVILDVVYNHTPEGSPGHPTWCFRGIDPGYYRRDARGHYEDFTGCGNTLDLRRPHVLRLVLDSLRLWVSEYHVDGFRFDLAPALARLGAAEPPEGAVWAAILQDPLLRDTKLIAEPWDVGHHGYRLGRFPLGFSEWNGEFRDTLRRFWRGDAGQLPQLGREITGAGERFAGRGTRASINYVTCHDGFTLEDLVSYEHKRNHANGEGNRDGHSPSYSSAWGGPEGPSEDRVVLARRARIKRSLLGSLCCAMGVPMLNMGDELGRTQGGNNNAYCQDNETSWVDWELDAARASLLEFVRRALTLRREEPLLHLSDHVAPDELVWRRPDGALMSRGDWADVERRAVGAWLAASQLGPRLPEHERARARDLLLLFNARASDETFRLPDGPWEVLLDTGEAAHVPGEVVVDSYEVGAGAFVVLGLPLEGRPVATPDLPG